MDRGLLGSVTRWNTTLEQVLSTHIYDEPNIGEGWTTKQQNYWATQVHNYPQMTETAPCTDILFSHQEPQWVYRALKATQYGWGNIHDTGDGTNLNKKIQTFW